MAYTGQQAPIPLGQLGLMTDDPMTSLPPNAAIKANNVRLYYSRLEKAKGSSIYNSTALPSGIVSLFDWIPSGTTQRLMALTAEGKLYRDTGSGTFNSNTSIATLTGTLTANSHMCAGGNEAAGNSRKLFIFTEGLNQIKVGAGDFTSVSSIATPSADWSAGNYPTFGCIFGDRLAVLGCASNRHTLYLSSATNHESFDTGTPADTPIFDVFPGEGEALVAAYVYKGRLFLFKKPYGVYYIETFNSSNPTDWAPQKLSDNFGIASPHAALQFMDDLVVGNNTGSLTSMQATQAFGDIKHGDVLANAQVEEYVKTQITSGGIPYMHAVFYQEKKMAMFTGRSTGSTSQNRILIVDTARQTPRITIETKDQPTCLVLRKDSSGIQRPIYGATDGHVYLMDSSTYAVGSSPYNGEFQTPYIDFSYMAPELASKNKLFDFLEVHFIATGNWSFYVDVFIDNKQVETLTFSQGSGSTLDSFILDTGTLGSEYTQETRKPLHGSGRRISFKIYNNNLNEFFKIEKLIVNFRLSGEQQAGFSGTFRV